MSLQIEKIHLSAQSGNYENFDPYNGNTDVIVILKSGETYVASFFTYSNIQQLQQVHKETGEYLKGRYFQASNMVLIENCELATIQHVVNDLIEEGDFLQTFHKL